MVGADVAAYFTLKVCLDLILDNTTDSTGCPSRRQGWRSPGTSRRS